MLKPAVIAKIEGANRTKVAGETGLHVSYVSMILSGRRNPTLTSAAKVAKSVGVTIDNLNEYLGGRVERANAAA